jgi:hypothetical protein
VFAIHSFREEFDRNPEDNGKDNAIVLQTARVIAKDL